ncbi:caspase-2 [Schistocerca piceifrons]|uniref:caspase-2 n=1 Tax=Schistocerca piceifrons TaxID=274613 RepID=UPI001F5FC583|nr:caspase-2 [Schistocerca piceifrons]XP_047113087.1 caspase-2 [Schistocerca piceifrons]XP_047113088.1 caspase-2 [Schistocerca piceifrons]
MEERDRQTIIKNLVQLVESTELNNVLSKLVENGVFSPRMAERYRLNKEPSVLKRDMYLDVTRRGPTAFNKLCNVLVETGHQDLARVLKPDIDDWHHLPAQNSKNPVEQVIPPKHGTIPHIIPNYLVETEKEIKNKIRELALEHPQSFLNMSTTPLKVNVKQATTVINRTNHNHIPVYTMLSHPKGYALIINNIQFLENIEPERRGAEIDERNLKDLLEGLGYDVSIYNDLCYKEMERKIEEFTKLEGHKSVDSCVVAVMSHGRAGPLANSTSIICYDGGLRDVEWVISKFDNASCPNLQGKPKIFFFQTCRGNCTDIGVPSPPLPKEIRTYTDGRVQNTIRKVSDMLIAFSTIPGYASHRDKYLGTWYIQTICQVFMEHAWNTDIEDMLKIVDQRISALMSDRSSVQTTSYENRGFCKKLYFNPGLYDDDNSHGGIDLQN